LSRLFISFSILFKGTLPLFFDPIKNPSSTRHDRPEILVKGRQLEVMRHIFEEKIFQTDFSYQVGTYNFSIVTRETIFKFRPIGLKFFITTTLKYPAEV